MIRIAAIVLALAALAAGGASLSGADFVAASPSPGNSFASASDFNTVAVTLADPGTPLRGTKTLTATASSERGIDHVTFQSAPAGTSTWTDACTANAAPYTCSWNTAGVADGSRDVRALGVDQAGYQRTAGVSARVVDNTAPTATLDDPGAYLTGTASLTARASDAGSGLASLAIAYRPAGGSWTTLCTGAATPRTCALNTAPLADGSYELRATATDVAGNVRETVLTRIVDNTAPTTAVNASSPVSGTIDVGMTAADGNGSGIKQVTGRFRAQGTTTWSTVCVSTTAPYGCTGLDTTQTPDGVYEVQAIAEDNAGFTTTSATATLRVDNTAPATATLTNPGSPLSGTEALSGGATDGGSGIASWTVQYKLSSGSTWADACSDTASPFGSCAWDTTGVADGLYDLRAIATDAVGNALTSATVTSRRIDNTAPAVALTAPSGTLSGTGVSLTATASDAGSGVTSVAFERSVAGANTWVSICTDNATPYTCSFNTAALVDGSYDLRARATDGAGNQTTSVVTRLIDNNTPSGTAVATGNGGTTAGLLEAGDWIAFTWSEPMAPASILTRLDRHVAGDPGHRGQQRQQRPDGLLRRGGHDAAEPRRQRDRPAARREFRDRDRVVQRHDGPERHQHHRDARLEHLGHAGHGRHRHDELAAVGERQGPGRQVQHHDDRHGDRRRGPGLLMRPAATLLATLSMALGAVGLAVAGPGREVASERLAAATGSVHISNSLEGRAIFGAEALRPGASTTGTVRIGNDGNVRSLVTLTGTRDAETGLASLANSLQLTVVSVEDALTLYSGPAAGFTTVAVGSLDVGESRELRFTATLPSSAGNALQGASTTLGLLWSASAAPGATPTPTATPRPVKPAAPRKPATPTTPAAPALPAGRRAGRRDRNAAQGHARPQAQAADAPARAGRSQGARSQGHRQRQDAQARQGLALDRQGQPEEAQGPEGQDRRDDPGVGWPPLYRSADVQGRAQAPVGARANVNCLLGRRRGRRRGFRRTRRRARGRRDETVLWRGFRRTRRRPCDPCDETHTIEAAFRRTDRARADECDEVLAIGDERRTDARAGRRVRRTAGCVRNVARTRASVTCDEMHTRGAQRRTDRRPRDECDEMHTAVRTPASLPSKQLTFVRRAGPGDRAPAGAGGARPRARAPPRRRSRAHRLVLSGSLAIVACVQSMIASPQGLAELLGQLMLHLHRSSAPELFKHLGELGLSFTQVKTLSLLRVSEGDVNVKDVATSLNMSFPAMSRSLDQLVQRGYVDRHESDKDRRAKLVRLLPAGRAVLDDIEQVRVSALEEVTALLSDEERAALHASLLPIVERIHTP